MQDINAEIGLAEAREHALQAQGQLPRRKLSAGVVALLWLLRAYVLIAVPLVVYAFFHALRHGN